MPVRRVSAPGSRARHEALEALRAMETPRGVATFIVRVFRNAGGELVGSVERVRTGERRPFHRADAIGPLIREMTRGQEPDPGPGAPESPRE